MLQLETSAKIAKRHVPGLREIGCVVAAVSLLPLLILGPMGPGAIIIHDHHTEDLHAHKVHHVANGQGVSRTANGHDHPPGTTDDPDSVGFVLILPDLPRLFISVPVSSLQMKSAPLSPAGTGMLSLWRSALPTRTGLPVPEAPLRADDAMIRLLLGGNALLI